MCGYNNIRVLKIFNIGIVVLNRRVIVVFIVGLKIKLNYETEIVIEMFTLIIRSNLVLLFVHGSVELLQI